MRAFRHAIRLSRNGADRAKVSPGCRTGGDPMSLDSSCLVWYSLMSMRMNPFSSSFSTCFARSLASMVLPAHRRSEEEQHTTVAVVSAGASASSEERKHSGSASRAPCIHSPTPDEPRNKNTRGLSGSNLKRAANHAHKEHEFCGVSGALQPVATGDSSLRRVDKPL